MSSNLNKDEDNSLRKGDSKTLTFCQLFEQEKIDFIEIPIIQRDYAQGRKAVAEVRKEFIEKFRETLSKKPDELKQPLDLDFIYGNIKEDGIRTFPPLDGQQRLTTLFLLHWYLACLDKKIDHFQALFSFERSSERYSRFTYKTRTSSKEFFDALAGNEIDLCNLLLPDKTQDDNKTGNALSKTIKNRQWFFLSWEHDPTIQSALIMLDEMHQTFSETKDMYEKLVNNDIRYITLQFLNLEDFGLSDDLYIKMNSRGKPLTSFENFKAKLEKHIESLAWESSMPYKLTFSNKESDVSARKYFSYKIDTVWADTFWAYKNTHTNDNTFDDEMMNFIRVIMAGEFACQNGKDLLSSPKEEDLEFLIGTKNAKKRKNYTDIFTFYVYEKFKILNLQAITFLINVFDSLEIEDGKLKEYLNDFSCYDEELVFKDVLQHDLTVPKRVQFYAYCLYLTNYNSASIDINAFTDWMRIIVNLSVKTRYDKLDDFIGSVLSIKKLIGNANNILDYLRDENNKIGGFNIQQIREERIKALLIAKSEQWKELIFKAEQHKYFEGQIEFLLKFSGILDFYEKNKTCDWDNATDIGIIAKYTDYLAKASAVFDDGGLKKTLSGPYGNIEAKLGEGGVGKFLWERAMLTTGDYLLNRNYERRSFLDNKNRDFSWRRLLSGKGLEDNMQDVENKRDIIKNVFDQLDAINIETSLETIISKKNPVDEWRRMFIEQPDMLKYCKKGYIRFNGPDVIYLLLGEKMSGWHVELYTYHLMFNVLNPMKEDKVFFPFTDIKNGEIYTDTKEPFVFLAGWQLEEKMIDLRLYFEHGTFKISPRAQGEEELAIPDNLKTFLLEQCKFEENIQNEISLQIDKDDVEKKLNEILAALKDFVDAQN